MTALKQSGGMTAGKTNKKEQRSDTRKADRLMFTVSWSSKPKSLPGRGISYSLSD